MKNIILAIFLMTFFFQIVIAQTQTEIDEQFAIMTIMILASQVGGNIPLPEGGVRTSADTYLVRGSGIGGDERLLVYTTNNILGVVAGAITDTGPNTERSFRLHREALNSPFLQLENATISENNIRGTLVTNGRRHRFSMEYIPANQQLVISVIRQ